MELFSIRIQRTFQLVSTNLWTCIIGKTFYMSDLYDVFFNYVSTMSLFFFFLLFCYFVSNRKFINKHIV